MSTKQQDLSNAVRRLNELMVGNHLSGFTTGDVWAVRLIENNYQLAFHNLSYSQENSVNQALSRAAPNFFDCADPDDIAKTVVLSAVLRREIISISIDHNASLTLDFEGGIGIVIATDTDVVDWQWCITKNFPNPFHEEYEVACFWKGEVCQQNHSTPAKLTRVEQDR